MKETEQHDPQPGLVTVGLHALSLTILWITGATAMILGLSTAAHHAWIGGLFLSFDIILRAGSLVTRVVSGRAARAAAESDGKDGDQAYFEGMTESLPRDPRSARAEITSPHWIIQRACAAAYGIMMIAVISTWAPTAVAVIVGVSYVAADLGGNYLFAIRLHKTLAAIAEERSSRRSAGREAVTTPPQQR
ncbi:hypothetical protein [Saccharopolyspora shandongensis]|uniref:hypothetical protein n=1 Tax=Saccharopolyspora shandongensis TaxID=418495 RepID=UPI00115FA0F8|nr:hypothetical protein [Saccharopolyspora shandongensis]